MLSWALMFLILALLVGALSLSGVAGAAGLFAWVLFVVGIVAAAAFVLQDRRPSR